MASSHFVSWILQLFFTSAEFVGLSEPLNDRPRRHGATTAHGDEGELFVASLQFVQCGGDEATTGRTDWVTKGDRTAVDVDLGHEVVAAHTVNLRP